ncbi:MAG: sulfotransferase [Anaerolineae bacterium]|nr:sulfotransferase [Anaerolineae bacterium]
MKPQSQALYRQATTFYRQGRASQAIESYRKLLEAEPQFADGWYDLGYLLRQQGAFDEALQAYQRALDCGVRDPQEVHLNRAVIYSDHLRMDDDAEQSLRQALALQPDYEPAQLNLGNLFEEQGRREDAIACYQAMLPAEGFDVRRLSELQLEALGRLSHLSPPVDADDPSLARLRRCASNASSQNPQVRANLYFALGRACDRLSLHDDAFRAFTEANRHAARTGPPYSPRGTEVQMQQLMTASRATSRPSAPIEGVQPLFVCGMFRSGSTLLEQIISGHPMISAGGELEHFPRLAAQLKGNLGAITDAECERFSTDYRNHLRRISDATVNLAFVSDKRPDNFLLIGLIKRIFPLAKIIHTVRNPLDNGLSLYMQHLHQRAAPHASDLAAIGHYYGQYRRLMAHWQSLYGEDIHRFDYDAFVRHPQPQVDALYAFLGLEPDANSLNFYLRRNTVKTASYWQVRRPLYREASGRWRHYQQHLLPLRKALEAAGVNNLDYPHISPPRH